MGSPKETAAGDEWQLEGPQATVRPDIAGGKGTGKTDGEGVGGSTRRGDEEVGQDQGIGKEGEQPQQATAQLQPEKA